MAYHEIHIALEWDFPGSGLPNDWVIIIYTCYNGRNIIIHLHKDLDPHSHLQPLQWLMVHDMDFLTLTLTLGI